MNILAPLPESLIYRSALGYGLVMRVLYGRYYGARDAAVATHVPDGASVLELCCGPGRLYRNELCGRVGSYIAIDSNAGFVDRLRLRGVDAHQADVATTDLPVADVVLMQASLYHFLPDAESMVRRMLSAARERVVISEPVRNLAQSRVAIVARLASAGAATAGGAQAKRFDDASLRQLMERFGETIVTSQLVPGGRERVYVLAGAAR